MTDSEILDLTEEQLDALIAEKRKMAKHLTAARNEAVKQGNQTRANDLGRMGTRLNRLNFRLQWARAKIQSQGGMQQTLDAMQQIIRDAIEVREDLENGADLLQQATKLINIIKLLADILA